MSESLSPGQMGGGVDRRAWIKKALTAGGVGYVAPMVLGSATPASAQAVSVACSGPGCESQCGPGNACACISIVGGGTACVDPICTDTPCTTSADCASNQVCMTTDCCGPSNQVGFCVALCGTTTGGGGDRPSRWAH